MMKKIFLIVLSFFVTVHAQDMNQDDFDIAYQELVYDIGMSLAKQNTVVDLPTAKNALSSVYQAIPDVMQIIDIYMMTDEEIVKHQITTIDALIDYEINGNQAIAQTGIALLSAYQNLFTVFMAMHAKDSSFEIWCNDMAFLASLPDDQPIEDPNYAQLWLASCVVLNAQDDFGLALRNVE